MGLDNDLKLAFGRLEEKVGNVESLLKNHLKKHWQLSMTLIVVMGAFAIAVVAAIAGKL